MKIIPDCPSVDNTLTVVSSVALNTGGGIPAYVSYNAVGNQFTVSPIDGTQPQILNMIVTFKVMQGTVVKITSNFP